MKRALTSVFLGLAAVLSAPGPLRAIDHPSKLSIGVEGGWALSDLGSDYGLGRLYGGRIKYDAYPRWSLGARFQNRSFELKTDGSQNVVIRPVMAEVYYAIREPGGFTPYAFFDLGMSHNRRAVFSVTRSNNKPCFGLGAGIELNFMNSYAVSLEAAHRQFTEASPGGHNVTENGLALVLTFRLPDEWVPIRPSEPLHIPDMDDPRFKTIGPPLPDVEKRQAQLELDKVQQDIRDHKVPPIHFETGQAVLLKASYETLDIVGTILRRYPAFSVAITGHTDEVGTKEDNEILSLARAEVVRSYLIQNFGLPSDTLTAAGAGESKPMAANDSEEGRFMNRRVEFTIQP